MTAYYNEWEPYPAQWLRNLITAGLIAPGDVDERSIKDVKADDLKGYTQCHFFAGIGGWSLALRLALWPDDRPVWTGSCPCQPFSSAGRHKGKSDERHIWPDWFKLIAECKPDVLFGEQTERAIAFGWLDDVQNAMEKIGYAFAPFSIPACATESEHERQRIWFVADAKCDWVSVRRRIEIVGNKVQDTTGIFSNVKSSGEQQAGKILARMHKTSSSYTEISPDVLRVVDGLPNRMGAMSGYGNAIVPQVAQAFIEAFMECRP